MPPCNFEKEFGQCRGEGGLPVLLCVVSTTALSLSLL